MIKIRFSLNIKKIIAIWVIAILISSSNIPYLQAANQVESVQKQFSGYTQAYSILNNMDYSDVRGKGLPTTKAIYQTGALGIIKGMGTKIFGRNTIMNKDEALATAYRAAGKEALAQQAADQLQSKAGATKATTLSKLWAKGFLKLAADDGIITKDQLNATLTNKTVSGTKPFPGSIAAQRQELAYWLSRTLGLEPEYEQQRLFNSFKDWKKVDPSKAAYIETALQQRIINGDLKGYLKPDAVVTREQAAQMVYNSLDFIYPLMKLTKYTGVIENLFERTKASANLKITTFNIRNENRTLHTIEVSKPATAINLPYNEQTTKLTAKGTADIIVYKAGVIGDSSLIKFGDKIEYTSTLNGVIRFVQVLPNDEPITLGSGSEDKNIQKGIVEENNQALGYITIFSDNNSSKPTTQLATFNYINPSKVDVIKNNKKANLDSIEPGDTVFVKLDKEGNVEAVSGVDNYTVKYGKIINISTSNLNVQFDGGEIQPLNIDTKPIVVTDGRLSTVSALRDGDTVRMTLHTTPQFTRLKEIRVENQPQLISNVYKAKFSYVDDMAGNIILSDCQVLLNNKWQRIDARGITTLKLSDNCSIFEANTPLNVSELGTLYSGNDVYLATKKDYGGGEIASVVSFIDKNNTERLYDDSITRSYNSTNTFTLTNSSINVSAEKGSIIIKNGRLVSESSLTNGDNAYVVASRDNYGTGEFKAGVVVANDRFAISSYQIYRGRIKQINENSDFTMESFSKLDGMSWNFNNTPKTFNITSQTGITASDGIVAQRDFVGYGSNNFINSVVYVVSDGINALQISTAPYAIGNARGIVYSVSNDNGTGASATEGQILMRKVKTYNQASGVWLDSQDITVKLPVNCIILKDGKLIKYSDIKNGSTVRVLRKDDTSTDACIVLVED